MAKAKAGDLVQIAEGTVVVFDMREIAVLICEGVLEITRPDGFTVDEAYDHMGAMNPKAQIDFTRAAHKVTRYIESLLVEHGTVLERQ